MNYRTLHFWVQKNLGKPNKCSKCGKMELNTKKIHWANKSGNYLENLSDWERLCILCHRKKDQNGLKAAESRKKKYSFEKFDSARIKKLYNTF